jgi:DNA-binding transcriptional LysR family regulator
VTVGLVRAGLGVALVPSLGLQGVTGVQLRRLQTAQLFRRIGVARRPTNPNPAARSFVAYLRTAAAQLRNSLDPMLR